MARVLILRPAADAEDTAQAVAARGHTPLLLPLHEIVRLGSPPPKGDFGGFLVTSSNAVSALGDAFPRDRRPVLAVGRRTGAQLRAAGFDAVIVGDGDGAGLAETAATLVETGSRPLLYAAGRIRTAGLEAALERRGVGFSAWEVYDTRAVEPDAVAVAAALGDGAPDAVLLLSAGQAEAYGRLAARLPEVFRPAPALFCLSPRIADALPMELRAAAVISDMPDLGALFDRIL